MYLFYEHELKKLLIHMGITPNYKGYGYIISAMRIIFEEPDCLQHVTKELYPEIAKSYQTDWRAVERSIRIALLRSWDKESEKFQKLFGLWEKEPPSVAKFLSILYMYFHLEYEEKAI